MERVISACAREQGWKRRTPYSAAGSCAHLQALILTADL